MRAVAGAEPAAPFAERVALVLAERNAAQMGAHADYDQPLGTENAGTVRFGIDQIPCIVLRPLSLLKKLFGLGICLPVKITADD